MTVAISVVALVCIEIESSLCNQLFFNKFGQFLVSRFYHSILLHTIIPVLFYSLSELVILTVEKHFEIESKLKVNEVKLE
jgi:hypothetical protein